MDYGRAIKLARTKRGLTQRQLGDAVGLDASHISRIEKGTRVPALEALEALSKALSVPMHLLILLASDSEHLRGVNSTDAGHLATELLALLLGSRETA